MKKQNTPHNEAYFTDLLLGIQNNQMEMMNMLQMLQQNVTAIKREISMIKNPEDAAPCPSPKMPLKPISEIDGSKFTTNDKSSVSFVSYDDENVSF